MKKIYFLIIFFCFLINFNYIYSSIITTLNKNDPQPLFTTAFPYNYVYQNEKEFYKNRTDCFDPQWFSFSGTAFRQTACGGKDIHSHKAELGDLTGRWNLLAALPFNERTTESEPCVCEDIPEGESPIPCLVDTRDKLLKCIDESFTTCKGPGTPAPVVACMPDQLKTIQGLVELKRPEPLLGFFSVPIKYRKTGVRFNFDFRFFGDFGFSFQTGVADISQVARFVDETNTPTQCIRPPGCTDPRSTLTAGPGVTCQDTSTTNRTICTVCGKLSCGCAPVVNPNLICQNPFLQNRVPNTQWAEVADCVHTELMLNYKRLAKAMGINLCDYHKTSIEDLYFEFWWRHAYNISPECAGRDHANRCWTPFLFVPFVALGGSIATGAKAKPSWPLSLPFGNNGHNTIRFNTGFTLDFYNTIEIGMHAGVTHFFKRTINNFRVPTNKYQNVFYPYTTNVKYEPGETWHIGLVMNAYHFLDCFSSWAEFLFVNHTRDCINLCKPKTAFVPKELECKTPWMVQLFNVALNYDISPNFTIGAAVQIPITQRNAYKSTTYLASLVITY